MEIICERRFLKYLGDLKQTGSFFSLEGSTPNFVSYTVGEFKLGETNANEVNVPGCSKSHCFSKW